MKSVFVLLLLLPFTIFASSEECENSDLRLVTRDELATKNGEDGADIWLSILGRVYDVTTGTDYYSPGQGYNSLCALDSSVPFVTGTFTPEEAEKDIDTVEDTALTGIYEWEKFYNEHDTYKFVGLLIDPRFYNERGEPQPSLVKARERWSKIQSEKEEEKKTS